MRKPNFLLMGPGKSGVGMISRYLHQHPQIYTSNEQELFYFVKDIVLNYTKEDSMYNAIFSQAKLEWDDYLEFFSHATKDEVFLGDSTKQYLYHYDTVIPQIKEKLGDIPIIIILRNPVPRAFDTFVYQNKNQLVSFEEALELEEERKKKGYNYIWFYKDAGNYCKAVKAYKDSFSRVYVGLYEDYENEPIIFLQSLYRFSGADATFIPEIKNIILPYLVPKNKFIQIIFYYIKKFKVNRILIPEILKKILRDFTYVENKDDRFSKMDKKTENMLKTYYKKDIKCLEKVLDKKLTEWL